MFERSYPMTGLKPVETMHRLLAYVRERDRLHTVTLGSPPFERDDLNRITAIRLRFRPRALQ